MNKIHPAAAAGILAFALAACGAMIWGYWRGVLSGWLVFGLAVALVTAIVFAFRLFEKKDDPNDLLRRWRGYRAAKTCTFAAIGSENCTLTLELTPENDLVGKPVVLRFHGVSDLVVRQMATWVLCFDYLVCEDRGADGKQKRFEVRDAWNEGCLEFTCDSFEEVRAGVDAAAHHERA